MAACSLPVQSQCYLLNSSPVSTIDRYEICEQKLRAYLGNAADYTRLTITDDMCTLLRNRFSQLGVMLSTCKIVVIVITFGKS